MHYAAFASYSTEERARANAKVLRSFANFICFFLKMYTDVLPTLNLPIQDTAHLTQQLLKLSKGVFKDLLINHWFSSLAQ